MGGEDRQGLAAEGRVGKIGVTHLPGSGLGPPCLRFEGGVDGFGMADHRARQ
jgi:hypothetical protein